LFDLGGAIANFTFEVASVIGDNDKIGFETSRPDGPPQKLLDVAKIKRLGWSLKLRLREGQAGAYADFLAGDGRSTG
jgi:GDP-L-fucose synthase